MPKKKMPPMAAPVAAKDKKKDKKKSSPPGNPFAKGKMAKGKKMPPGMNSAAVPPMLGM